MMQIQEFLKEFFNHCGIAKVVRILQDQPPWQSLDFLNASRLLASFDHYYRKTTYRSLHCLPDRSGISLAISFQLLVPYCITSCTSFSSSLEQTTFLLYNAMNSKTDCCTMWLSLSVNCTWIWMQLNFSAASYSTLKFSQRQPMLDIF